MIDASIPMSFKPPELESPLAAMAKALQVKSMNSESRLADLAFTEKQRAIDDSNKLTDLMRASYDPTTGKTDNAKLERTLSEQGTYNQLTGFRKQLLDQQEKEAKIGKDNADIGKTKFEVAKGILGLVGSAAGAIAQNPTQENATQILTRMKQLLPKEAGDLVTLDTLPTDPAKIKEWATSTFRQSIDAAKQLEDERIKAEGAANRSVTMRGQNMTQATAMRGQNMTDSRARETNNKLQYDSDRGVLVDPRTGATKPVVGTDGKPIGQKEKPLTDSQSKAALFGSRMKASNDVMASLEKDGTTISMPGAQTGFGVSTIMNAISSAKQQQLTQAKRDFLNAVLRRESGAVIADSEFRNGEQQYFPQIGDSKEVRAQKKSNREIAIRGVLSEVPEASKGVLDDISGNTGDRRPPLDDIFK